MIASNGYTLRTAGILYVFLYFLGSCGNAEYDENSKYSGSMRTTTLTSAVDSDVEDEESINTAEILNSDYDSLALVESSDIRDEIIVNAINELGNDDDQCEEPGCYFAGGDTKVNWCSEFVSWVYHVSGNSFTSGYFSRKVRELTGERGRWMQRSTTRIINWFHKNAVYIDRSHPDWDIISPKPGDYILIGRAGSETRRHSAIVEYIDEDGTLHALEGNNSRRDVARFQYPAYKTNTTDNGSANGIVLGFGLLNID
ncbi:MAG: CHAP domain-containing protein [Oligoflexales bacterium]